MKTNDLLLIGGAGLAAYYIFVAKPKQDIDTGFAAGAGAVNAVGAGAGNIFGGMTDFFNSLFPTGATPTPQGHDLAVGNITAFQEKVLKQAQNSAINRAKWIQAGGTMQGSAYVLPNPMAHGMGLTIQQPEATRLLTQSQLASVTTLDDFKRVLANRQVESAIKKDYAAGTRVIGHRTIAVRDASGATTGAFLNKYTLKSPTGAITYETR